MLVRPAAACVRGGTLHFEKCGWRLEQDVLPRDECRLAIALTCCCTNKCCCTCSQPARSLLVDFHLDACHAYQIRYAQIRARRLPPLPCTPAGARRHPARRKVCAAPLAACHTLLRSTRMQQRRACNHSDRTAISELDVPALTRIRFAHTNTHSQPEHYPAAGGGHDRAGGAGEAGRGHAVCV